MKADNGVITQQDKLGRLSISLILIFAVIRTIIAFSLELGTDEAYYWLYSQDLKLNYFDHPPIVAFWIRLSTVNLKLQFHEGFLRLGSIVSCALASWFIFKTSDLLHSKKAGLFGVILYNTSFFADFTAGLFIMPDAPLMLFYTFCLFLIARICKDDNSWIDWILFGISAGLCIMSKIYGILPWTGLGLFILLQKRQWLKKRQLYIAIFLSILTSLPILFWNIKYDFATHKYHSERITIVDDHINVLTVLHEIANQLLYNNPCNVIAGVLAIGSYFKKNSFRQQALTIYNFIGLPLAILLFGISIDRDTTLQHWSGPAYTAIIPLTSIYLASLKRTFPKILSACIASYFIYIIVWLGVIEYYSGDLGKQISYSATGSNNNTFVKFSTVLSGFTRLQLVAEPADSWSRAAEQFKSIYDNNIRRGIMKPNKPVICNKWWGAQIDYYFCFRQHIQMLGIGNMREIGEYMWMNGKRQNKADVSSAYCLVPAIDSYDVRSRYADYYCKIDSLTVISIPRKHRPAVNFFVYTL